jgi:hypothetical protein
MIHGELTEHMLSSGSSLLVVQVTVLCVLGRREIPLYLSLSIYSLSYR